MVRTRSATAAGSDVQDRFGCEPAILIAAGEPLTRQFLQRPGQKSANPPASPGGHVAGGETSLAAAREVQEETGVTVPAADLSQWAPTTPSAAIPAAGTSRSPCPRLLPTRLKVTCEFAIHVPGTSHSLRHTARHIRTSKAPPSEHRDEKPTDAEPRVGISGLSGRSGYRPGGRFGWDGSRPAGRGPGDEGWRVRQSAGGAAGGMRSGIARSDRSVPAAWASSASACAVVRVPSRWGASGWFTAA